MKMSNETKARRAARLAEEAVLRHNGIDYYAIELSKQVFNGWDACTVWVHLGEGLLAKATFASFSTDTAAGLVEEVERLCKEIVPRTEPAAVPA